MRRAGLLPSQSTLRRANIRVGLILAAAALLCYLGIYAWYVW